MLSVLKKLFDSKEILIKNELLVVGYESSKKLKRWLPLDLAWIQTNYFVRTKPDTVLHNFLDELMKFSAIVVARNDVPGGS